MNGENRSILNKIKETNIKGQIKSNSEQFKTSKKRSKIEITKGKGQNRSNFKKLKIKK